MKLLDLFDKELVSDLDSGACDCSATGPRTEYHDRQCKYRLATDALNKINQYKELALQLEVENRQIKKDGLALSEHIIDSLFEEAHDFAADVQSGAKYKPEALGDINKMIHICERFGIEIQKGVTATPSREQE